MIPLVRPIFPEKEDIWHFFKESLDTGQISNFGPCFWKACDYIDAFTQKHSIPVKSGTCAIKVALQTIFPTCSTIMLPDYTHIGTLNAVVQAGMIPILAPVERTTWTLSRRYLKKYRKIIDGAIVVSPFGYQVDTEEYDAIAGDKLKLVYDFAGAWGMFPHTRFPVCYSLHGTKNFSCGEGGIATFATEMEREAARRLTTFDIAPDRSIQSPEGYNGKPSEMLCAIICAHLANILQLENRMSHKKLITQLYKDALKGIATNYDLDENGSPSLCVFSGFDAARIEKMCESYGFVAKQYFPVLSRIEGLYGVKRVGTSEGIFDNCIALPSDVTTEELLFIVNQLDTMIRSDSCKAPH